MTVGEALERLYEIYNDGLGEDLELFTRPDAHSADPVTEFRVVDGVVEVR